MSRSTVHLVRFLGMIVIAVSIMCAPAAEALHSDQKQDAPCESVADHQSVSEDSDPDNSHKKTHHAHHCGGCHLHIYHSLFGDVTPSADVFASLLPLTDIGPGLLQPDGPVRPPRS